MENNHRPQPLKIFLVRVGMQYPLEYVENLARQIGHFMPEKIRDADGFQIICLTDTKKRPEGKIPYLSFLDVSGYMARYGLYGRAGWWAKMLLFDPALTGTGPRLFFDLDTVILDDLTPLIGLCGVGELKSQFYICENFTKLAGHKDWPCNYGSCLMFIPSNFGAGIWEQFAANPAKLIAANPRGDQQAIEALHPNACFFQDGLPPGYLVGRRDIGEIPPKNAAVLIFAGSHKPHNSYQWVKDAWRNVPRAEVV